MSKKVTDQDPAMAKQFADAIAYAINNGKYVPLAAFDEIEDGTVFSPLDVLTQCALSQLMTIAALDGSRVPTGSANDRLLQLHSMRRKYPELTDMIDFVILRMQNLEDKRKAFKYDQWIVSSMEPGVKSGELFKRLHYLISR